LGEEMKAIDRKYLLVDSGITSQEVRDEKGAQRAHQDFSTRGGEEGSAGEDRERRGEEGLKELLEEIALVEREGGWRNITP